MDTILPHGGDASQGGYLRNVPGAEPVRLIRQQHDLRVLLRHLPQFHPRVAFVAPLEDVGATADRDEVVHVGARANSHPGVAPDGTEGAHRWPALVGGADLRQRLSRPFDDPPGLRAGARHRRQLRQQFKRSGHGRGKGHVDLEPLADQRLDVLLAVLLSAGDDEVGLKGYYPGDVQRLGSADPRLLGDGVAGLDAKVGDAHEGVISTIDTPRMPLSTRPLSISSCTIGPALSMAIARPIPSASPRMTAVVMPTTCPRMLTSGPPA